MGAPSPRALQGPEREAHGRASSLSPSFPLHLILLPFDPSIHPSTHPPTASTHTKTEMAGQLFFVAAESSCHKGERGLLRYRYSFTLGNDKQPPVLVRGALTRPPGHVQDSVHRALCKCVQNVINGHHEGIYSIPCALHVPHVCDVSGRRGWRAPNNIRCHCEHGEVLAYSRRATDFIHFTWFVRSFRRAEQTCGNNEHVSKICLEHANTCSVNVLRENPSLSAHQSVRMSRATTGTRIDSLCGNGSTPLVIIRLEERANSTGRKRRRGIG